MGVTALDILIRAKDEASRSIAGVGKSVEGTSAKMRALSGAAKVGKYALVGLGAAAIGIGYESTKMGAQFQSAMELIHTQAGASQAEVDRMQKSVLGLAGKVGTAPDELAKGLYHLESTGLRGAKALAALKVAAEGAKTGQANLEDVTNSLNAVIASHITGARNLNEAMGALNATVGAGDMRMQDLADAMGTGVLAVVKGFGLSLNDVGAALATFGDNNIRGANAATQLRMAVLFMAKPAKSAGAALKGIGLTTKSLAADMRSGGLGKALIDLRTHLDKAGDGGKKMGQVLVSAFGHKAGTGLSVLVSQLSRFKSKQDEVRKGSSKFGADYQATTKTLSFQTDQLKATIDALGTKLGLWLIPKLQEAAAVTLKVVQWFQKHRDAAIAVATAVGGVLVVAIGAAIVSMATLAVETIAATWPILAIIAAVGLLTAGLVLAWRHSETFRNIVKGAFHAVAVAVDFVKNHWRAFATVLASLIGGPIIGAIVLLVTHFGTVKNAAISVKDFVVRAFNGIVGFFASLPGRIAHATVGMFDGIKNAFRSAINWIIGGWNRLHFSMPGVNTHIPGVGKIGGFSIGMPQIPYLANGGIATRATLAVIGEAGPEAVIPLSRAGGMLGNRLEISLDRHRFVTAGDYDIKYRGY